MQLNSGLTSELLLCAPSGIQTGVGMQCLALVQDSVFVIFGAKSRGRLKSSVFPRLDLNHGTAKGIPHVKLIMGQL